MTRVIASPPLARVLGLVPAIVLALAACTATVSPAPTGAPTPTVAPTSTAATTPAATPAPAFPVTLTDDEGTAVALATAPTKIVSLTPATTEILFAIGAGDRVVAKVEDVADFPAEAHDLPVVATFAGVEVEKIVALGADLVISGGVGLSQGPAVEQLRRAGIAVLVLYPATVAGALVDISLTGRAVGREADAEALVASMQAQIAALSLAVAEIPKPRIFYEIDATNGIFTPPADSIYGEMLGLAGSIPASGNASYSISLEELVTFDPEVILLGDAAYGVTAEQVAARPGWGGLTAVTDGRIVPIDDIVVTRPGPRLVDGIRALILAIHPGLVLPAASPAP